MPYICRNKHLIIMIIIVIITKIIIIMIIVTATALTIVDLYPLENKREFHNNKKNKNKCNGSITNCTITFFQIEIL